MHACVVVAIEFASAHGPSNSNSVVMGEERFIVETGERLLQQTPRIAHDATR